MDWVEEARQTATVCEALKPILWMGAAFLAALVVANLIR